MVYASLPNRNDYRRKVYHISSNGHPALVKEKTLALIVSQLLISLFLLFFHEASWHFSILLFSAITFLYACQNNSRYNLRRLDSFFTVVKILPLPSIVIRPKINQYSLQIYTIGRTLIAINAEHRYLWQLVMCMIRMETRNPIFFVLSVDL